REWQSARRVSEPYSSSTAGTSVSARATTARSDRHPDAHAQRADGPARVLVEDEAVVDSRWLVVGDAQARNEGAALTVAGDLDLPQAGRLGIGRAQLVRHEVSSGGLGTKIQGHLCRDVGRHLDAHR